jgi:hypothetical protein
MMGWSYIPQARVYAFALYVDKAAVAATNPGAKAPLQDLLQLKASKPGEAR